MMLGWHNSSLLLCRTVHISGNFVKFFQFFSLDCVLLCFIDPRVRKIRNEAASLLQNVCMTHMAKNWTFPGCVLDDTF